MTDDQDPITAAPEPAGPASTNGHAPAAKATVRSGLAQRRNPALVRAKEIALTLRRVALRDPLALFLLLASIGLAVAFATLLGEIKPGSSGHQVPISTVQSLAKSHEIASATLLDHDSRVEVTTTGAVASSTKGNPSGGTSQVITPVGSPEHLWAAYPSSGAQTQQLADELANGHAIVSIDQQSGKPTKAIIVQFLIPILLLVCLFSLFMRAGGEGAAGGIAGFSEFTGKGRKKGKGRSEAITFDDVAGAGEALAELREIRDYLADPSKYLAVGAAAPKGVLLVGPPGTGKTLLAKAVAVKPTHRSFRSRDRTSSSRSSASALREFATCSARPAKSRPRSSSSTSSTPPDASGAPASGRAMTSASRRSTRSSSRWTGSPAMAASS
jgi:cell division protease FtsH